jgi:hypothetical protein
MSGRRLLRRLARTLKSERAGPGVWGVAAYKAEESRRGPGSRRKRPRQKQREREEKPSTVAGRLE